MIVTIDGPAGAGKSTVTRLLAKKLGFKFLDTGAMYRAVTWAAMDRGIDWSEKAELCELAKQLKIEFKDQQVFVDGQNVTQAIRAPEVTRHVVFVADSAEIRSHLVELQRRIGESGAFVCEGRDQGTVAFPDSFCKIFLTASSQSRALRRVRQMEASGKYVDFDQVLREQETRDQQDLEREIGALVKATDAVELHTDNYTLDEVVEELYAIVQQRLSTT